MTVNNKDLNLSYWELKQYYTQWDLIVAGSGIVGLSTALSFSELCPAARILILERGVLPSGASTKNAGFACFGTMGELLDDLANMPDASVWNTVKMRWEGLQLLKNRIGLDKMDYEQLGGYELFFEEDEFETASSRIPELNKRMDSLLGIKNCFETVRAEDFGFRGVKGIIRNGHEGQIDTGKTISYLLTLARQNGISVLNAVGLTKISEDHNFVNVTTSSGDFRCTRLVVATNGFARELLEINDVQPARAQVLVTSPIEDLPFRGSFHFDKGYYYFRNIHDRVLFGGGRHLARKEETTTTNALNVKIQSELARLLREQILPYRRFSIDHQWTGIMGMGNEKAPIIKKTGNRTVAAVRMGGMGIAIGSLVGRRAAEMACTIE